MWTAPSSRERTRKHSVGYKKAVRQRVSAKLTLEELNGERTLRELAKTYSVHLNMIFFRKRQLFENAVGFFEKEGNNKA